MSEVHLPDNDSLDNALKRFKRSCAKAGVLSDLRKKEYYQSPSVKRRKKSEAARKNKNKRYS
jgi:small subunit ribosomal protein S21